MLLSYHGFTKIRHLRVNNTHIGTWSLLSTLLWFWFWFWFLEWDFLAIVA